MSTTQIPRNFTQPIVTLSFTSLSRDVQVLRLEVATSASYFRYSSQKTHFEQDPPLQIFRAWLGSLSIVGRPYIGAFTSTSPAHYISDLCDHVLLSQLAVLLSRYDDGLWPHDEAVLHVA